MERRFSGNCPVIKAMNPKKWIDVEYSSASVDGKTGIKKDMLVCYHQLKNGCPQADSCPIFQEAPDFIAD